jgi:hypothetical protein
MSLYPEITEVVPSLYERCATLITERDYLRDIARTLAARVHQNRQAAKAHLEDMACKLQESKLQCMQVEKERERAESTNVFLQNELEKEKLFYARFVPHLEQARREKDDDLLKIAELESQLAAKTLLLDTMCKDLLHVDEASGAMEARFMLAIAELESKLAAKTLLLETMCNDLHEDEAIRLVNTFVPEWVSEATQTEVRPGCKDAADQGEKAFPDANSDLETSDTEIVRQEAYLEHLQDIDFSETSEPSVEYLPETSETSVEHLQDIDFPETSETENVVHDEKDSTNLFMFDSNTVVLETSDAEVVHYKTAADQLRSALAGKTNKDLNALSVAELTAYLGWIGKTYVKPKAKSIAILRSAVAE